MYARLRRRYRANASGWVSQSTFSESHPRLGRRDLTCDCRLLALRRASGNGRSLSPTPRRCYWSILSTWRFTSFCNSPSVGALTFCSDYFPRAKDDGGEICRTPFSTFPFMVCFLIIFLFPPPARACVGRPRDRADAKFGQPRPYFCHFQSDVL